MLLENVKYLIKKKVKMESPNCLRVFFLNKIILKKQFFKKF